MRTEQWQAFLPVSLSLSVFPSHRSSTRQRHGRCSKCLRRSTKSCTRGEAAEEGYSRGCRMSVSSGPHVSHIFGMLSTVSYQPPDLLLLSETGQQWDQRLILIVETNLKKHSILMWKLDYFTYLFIVCVTQDPGDSDGVSQWWGLPVVCYFRDRQLCQQPISRQREQCEIPGER